MSCKALYGYSYLIEQTRLNDGNVSLAVQQCVNDNVLKDYLEKYGSEVINMLNIEYNADKAKEYLVNESREDGIEQGRAEGQADMIQALLKIGRSIKEIAEFYKTDVDEIRRILA